MLTPVVLSLLLLTARSTSALFFPDSSHTNGYHALDARSNLDLLTLTVDIPTKLLLKRSSTSSSPSSSLLPVISVSNLTNWNETTNQLCIQAINTTEIDNPAGVVPCYNVLSFDPNTGIFLGEVRLFQVPSLVQDGVLSQTTGSGVLFEFPDATINSSPDNITSFLGSAALQMRKRQLNRRQTGTSSTTGQTALIDAFYMNGTADLGTQLTTQELLTPTTATLTLNISAVATPFSMTDSLVMFVNGLFSPNFNATQITMPTANVTAAAATTSTGLNLPGCSFGIVPIGFYLYSAYSAVFTAVLLWGAWNKRKYRDAFRRRRAAVLNFTAGNRFRV